MDNEKLYEDMKPKEKFEVLWAESGLADRPGAENLWQQMVALGFFEKPASIKHHSNHPGGLCEHSVCVAEAAMELCRTNHAFKKCHQNEVLAAALLHDYCKVGQYRDKGNGEYEYFDAGLVGHGEGSVIMAQQYIKLFPTDIVTPVATWCPSGSYSKKHGQQHKGVFTTDRAKNRAKTFTGVANAMSEQWG